MKTASTYVMREQARDKVFAIMDAGTRRINHRRHKPANPLWFAALVIAVNIVATAAASIR